MEAIRFEGVSKEYSIRPSLSIKDALLGIAGRRPARTKIRALDNVSFSIESGDAVALLGHNGSGKSTALKLLSGVLRPAAGTIRARGQIAPLLELGSGFHPDLTGRENIFLNAGILGIPRVTIRRRFDEILDFAEVEEFIDTPVKFYSSGMAIRLGFSVAVHVDPEILLVDEVLAVGDSAFQEKSLARMRQFKEDGATLILVTHNRSQAEDFCERGLLLDHGRLVFDGPIDEAPGSEDLSVTLS